MVVKLYFEPSVEPIFYKESYGYRPNKSAIQAIEVIRTRCCRKDWVLEFDIKGLFDNIRHDYLMNGKTPYKRRVNSSLYTNMVGCTISNGRGDDSSKNFWNTAKWGGVSPVLANLFLHYVFAGFMLKEFPSIPWARYADDGIAHCASL